MSNYNCFKKHGYFRSWNNAFWSHFAVDRSSKELYIYIYNITANFLKMEESRDGRGGKVIIAFEDFATFENFPLVPSFEVKLQEKLKVYIFLTMSRVTPSFPVVSTFSRVLDRFPLSLPSLLPFPIFQNILPSSSRFF